MLSYQQRSQVGITDKPQCKYVVLGAIDHDLVSLRLVLKLLKSSVFISFQDIVTASQLNLSQITVCSRT
jgi:hypothetical protein